MASGATVRDRKKESFWRHLKAQSRCGLSVAALCRRHGLRQYGFYWWRRELARRDAVVPAAFVPVHVMVERPAEERGGIKIVLPCDRRGGRDLLRLVRWGGSKNPPRTGTILAPSGFGTS